MRLFFLGTPEPAAKILEALIKAKHEIVCVITPPDRPRGRGQKISFSPVKERAVQHGLRVEQGEFRAILQSLKPDLAVVAAYGKILPAEILSIPRLGFINLHASLLPQYRGAAPIPWALLNGETKTGVTIFKLVPALDAGPIIAQQEVEIADADNAITLTEKLFSAGTELLLNVLGKDFKLIPQDEQHAAYAPSISKESGEIDWKKSAGEIHNRVRALINWPTAQTYYKGKSLKLLKTQVLPGGATAGAPGEILEVDKTAGIVVATGQGQLLIESVKPEGKQVMKAYAFAIGHGLKTGEVLPS